MVKIVIFTFLIRLHLFEWSLYKEKGLLDSFESCTGRCVCEVGVQIRLSFFSLLFGTPALGCPGFAKKLTKILSKIYVIN